MYQDDDSALEERTCAGCNAKAPATRTVYTLLSEKHKWRVRRTTTPDGDDDFAWFCPACWQSVHQQ